jgi:molybdenum cofactor sulfurtransferase
VEVYCETGFRDASVQGPVVTFNLQRADTSWVGFAEVERLASLRGVHLRTGCFCNAGACQQYVAVWALSRAGDLWLAHWCVLSLHVRRYLNINHAQLMRIVKAGYTCGSTTDVVDGRPVGCIRVSFGYMSTIADAEALLAFISGSFLETAPTSAALVALASGEIYAAAEQQPPESLKDRPAPVRLSKICVFPIKSCGAFEVDSWNIDEQGLW